LLLVLLLLLLLLLLPHVAHRGPWYHVCYFFLALRDPLPLFCFVSLQLIVVVIVVIIVLCFLAFLSIETSVFSRQVCVVAKVAMIHNKISSICGYKLNITLIY
jgi:hypothetical protein